MLTNTQSKIITEDDFTVLGEQEAILRQANEQFAIPSPRTRTIFANESTTVKEDEPQSKSATLSDRDLLKQSSMNIASFVALQEWDGYVLSVETKSFTARLTDVTRNGEKDDQQSVIPFAELTDDVINRLEPGALFRWSIGYQRSISGQKSRVSRIVLRQLPRWNAAQMKKAKDRANEIAKSIQWT